MAQIQSPPTRRSGHSDRVLEAYAPDWIAASGFPCEGKICSKNMARTGHSLRRVPDFRTVVGKCTQTRSTRVYRTIRSSEVSEYRGHSAFIHCTEGFTDHGGYAGNSVLAHQSECWSRPAIGNEAFRFQLLPESLTGVEAVPVRAPAQTRASESGNNIAKENPLFRPEHDRKYNFFAAHTGSLRIGSKI